MCGAGVEIAAVSGGQQRDRCTQTQNCLVSVQKQLQKVARQEQDRYAQTQRCVMSVWKQLRAKTER